MILKISPADVVSIPTDYNGAKGRCMRYEVVGQVDGPPSHAFAGVVNSEYNKPVSPATEWPFPVSGPVHSEEDDVMYNVVRVHGGAIVAMEISLEDAEAMVEKNVRQKKAMLKIVLSDLDLIGLSMRGCGPG
jgi:hypothetical protein